MRYKYMVVREVSQKEDKCEIQVHGRERSESEGRYVWERVKEGSNRNTGGKKSKQEQWYKDHITTRFKREETI